MKIEVENWLLEEGINVEMVTLESEEHGTMLIAISLGETEKSVYITSMHYSDGEIEVKGLMEMIEREAIIETFPTIELAQQFYDEIKEPMKLSEFIKGRKN